MSSIVVAGDTSGSVTISAPAVAGTPTLTLPTTSGTIITTASTTGLDASVISSGTMATARLASGSATSSTYLRGDQTWATISSGSMTLLGTITVTAANSVSLGSLSLSGYKQLCIVYKSLSCNTANSLGYISSDNTTSAARLLYLYSSPTSSGITWIDLGTGAASGGIGYDVGDGTNAGIGLSNVSTSTTTLYFRLASTNTFTATGSIKVYGVV